jgi:O-antigen ligase
VIPLEYPAPSVFYTFLLIGISYFMENRKIKYFLLFVCACNFYPILYSFSRAAYTSTLVGFLTLGVLKDRKFLGLVVVLVFFYSFILPTSVVERINMTFLEETQVSAEKEQTSAVEIGGVELDTVGRKELWEKAIKYFNGQPLLGIGFDTFRHLEGKITHNMFLKILAEQGLVGMTIFVFFTSTLLWQGYRLFKRSTNNLGKGIGLGFFTCTIVHLVGSVSGDQSLYYNLMAIYWLFAGIVASFNILFTSNVRIST